MRSAVEADFKELIREPFELWEDGELKIAYMMPEDDLEPLRSALGRIRYQESFRTGGLKSRSRIFGFNPRSTLRKDFCSVASLAVDHPAEHAEVCRGAAIAGRIYRDVNPALYKKHKAIAEEKVEEGFHLEGQAFTSGIINENNPLKYHFDSGNFKDVWSAMLVFKKHVGGGYLSLPEYGIGVELRDKSLFLFDGQGILHGVTPIKRIRRDSKRYSIVFYSLKAMWNCEPIGSELERIKRIRTGRETRRK